MENMKQQAMVPPPPPPPKKPQGKDKVVENMKKMEE